LSGGKLRFKKKLKIFEKRMESGKNREKICIVCPEGITHSTICFENDFLFEFLYVRFFSKITVFLEGKIVDVLESRAEIERRLKKVKKSIKKYLKILKISINI